MTLVKSENILTVPHRRGLMRMGPRDARFNEVHLMAQCRGIETLVDARSTRSDGEVDGDESVEDAMMILFLWS